MPDAQLQAMDPAVEAASWAEELGRDDVIFIVADSDDHQVVGFAFGGMSSETIAGLAELFVHADHHGKGVAQVLLAEFARRVQVQGALSMRGLIAECNGRSRAFCAKSGAHEVAGSQTTPVLGHVPGFKPIELPAIFVDWKEIEPLTRSPSP